MTRAQRTRLVVVLGLLIAIGPLTIDMYLPALPSITADLATTAAAVQLTLTGTLAGLALGQLFIGPLSDAVGRRLPLIAGLVVHVVASLLCVVAPEHRNARRAARAAGPGDGGGLGRRMAVVRDMFSGSLAAKAVLPADAGHGRRADPGADPGQRRCCASRSGAASSWCWPLFGVALVALAVRWRCPRRCRSTVAAGAA